MTTKTERRAEEKRDIQLLGRTAQAGLGPALIGISDQVAKLQSIQDREGEEEAVGRAASFAGRASARDEAQFERATRSFDPSARQQRGANRRLGLARKLNRARASGATRRGFADRSKIASRVGGSLADELFAQQISAETDITSIATAKKSARIQRNADKKSSLISGLGTVAGIALSVFSSEKLKDKQGPATGFLEKLKKVRVEKWNYKGATRRHVGPFAEEFNDAFEVNQDNRGMINVIDALGVTLGAVKELDRKIEAHGT